MTNVRDRAAVGRSLAATRVAVGVGLLVAPGLGAWLLGHPGHRTAARAIGVRDVVLGLLAERATPGSPAWRQSMLLSAAADGMDAVIAAAGVRHGRSVAGLTVATATAGAAVGVWAASAAAGPLVPYGPTPTGSGPVW